MSALADNRGAERSASPFVEEGFAFFDKLKAPVGGPGLSHQYRNGRFSRRRREGDCSKSTRMISLPSRDMLLQGMT